jgi:hypothetical protein
VVRMAPGMSSLAVFGSLAVAASCVVAEMALFLSCDEASEANQTVT